jgi:hypothetical protein
VLADYVEHKTATDRKDLVNIFVVIPAGVVGPLTAIERTLMGVRSIPQAS